MLKSNKLLLLISVMVATSFAVTLISFGQNPSSSTNKNQTETRQLGGSQHPAPPTAPQDFSKNTWDLPADADKTKNPVATTEESVDKGKELYLAKTKGDCDLCHDQNGTADTQHLRTQPRTP